MGSFKAGDTFLLAKPGQKQHLFVVLCDPAGTPPTILAVPFNTATFNTDTTLILTPGDHPFITRQTAVSYDLMLSIEVQNLDQLEQLCAQQQTDSFRRQPPASATLLARILDGALRSDLTPKGLLRTLKERLGIEG